MCAVCGMCVRGGVEWCVCVRDVWLVMRRYVVPSTCVFGSASGGVWCGNGKGAHYANHCSSHVAGDGGGKPYSVTSIRQLIHFSLQLLTVARVDSGPISRIVCPGHQLVLFLCVVLY